jgi:hypothetical protein
VRVPVGALLAILPLAGWAAMREMEAKATEPLLAAAGFRAEPADGPAGVATLQAMPPLEMVSQWKVS